MAKARKILSRLTAVKNVRTVTFAMETVARSRFRKIHAHAAAVRAYTAELTEMVEDIARRCEPGSLNHPLLSPPTDPAKEHALIVLTSNRGLCAGFNASVLSLASERIDQLTAAGLSVKLRVVGRKGVAFFRRRGTEIHHAYTDLGPLPDFADAAALAQELMDDFTSGKTGALEVVYMQFISPSRQSPAVAQLLPPARPEATGEKDDLELAYEFLPTPHEILSRLLPATVRLRLFQCFLDSCVGEQIARIAAMRGANENADEMIHDLNIRYNRVRQSQITTELAEIMGGREALA